MRTASALFTSSLLCWLALSPAHAGEKRQPSPLPQGYDLLTLSRGPSTVTPGLEPSKNMNETATVLSAPPATGGGASPRLEWSGSVEMGVVYKNTKKAINLTETRAPSVVRRHESSGIKVLGPQVPENPCRCRPHTGPAHRR
jgi:hypothetical protein